MVVVVVVVLVDCIMETRFHNTHVAFFQGRMITATNCDVGPFPWLRHNVEAPKTPNLPLHAWLAQLAHSFASDAFDLASILSEKMRHGGDEAGGVAGNHHAIVAFALASIEHKRSFQEALRHVIFGCS